MAVLASRIYVIPGSSGASRGYKAIATLASGTVDIPHGFKVIESVSITPVHADTAVDETFTLTGVTIQSSGFLKATAGISAVKSANGSSTATVSVDITGY